MKKVNGSLIDCKGIRNLKLQKKKKKRGKKEKKCGIQAK